MSLAVLGRLGAVTVLTTGFLTCALGAAFTAAAAFGLRVLVLRALGAVAADAVINDEIRLTVLIYMKKPPSGGLVDTLQTVLGKYVTGLQL